MTTAADLEAVVRPLTGEPGDFDALIERIGNATYVLLGEASHGTHEFYKCRADITRRLIAECGFTAVAVEADWPDAYRVHQFVQNDSSDGSATQALGAFVRFPQWMWRNTDVLAFVEWLRTFNDAREGGAGKVGFYGLDLYSLQASMAAVLAYLETVDVEAAARARARYACFDHFGNEPQRYGHAASMGVPSCERQALAQLVELQRASTRAAQRGDPHAHFAAQQNARLVSNAERYYRMMFTEGERSWNFRDRHMADTLFALTSHLGRHEPAPRIVVWAHNSHLGDARATDMTRRGELNLGQLVRERAADDCVLVGFSTYAGTVMAARDWDGPAERKTVRPALEGSHEALLREVPVQNFYLDLNSSHPAVQTLHVPRLERAIGVIYRPETERHSHYFHARLAEQFDALFHYDVTRAVEPLPASVS